MQAHRDVCTTFILIGENVMRVRMLLGALALCAGILGFSATQASAQSTRIAAVAASEASRANIYVYPGSFPCTPGPGYCRRVIIIIISRAEAVCQPDHDYTNTGNIKMSVGTENKESVGYIADITGRDVPESMLLRKGQIAIATSSFDPPPNDLD